MADSYGVYISGLSGDVEEFVAALVAKGMSEANARKVAASIPTFVKREVQLEVAQKFKRVFEEAGALVAIEDWETTNNPAAFTPMARPAPGPQLELADPALGTPPPPAMGYEPSSYRDFELDGAAGDGELPELALLPPGVRPPGAAAMPGEAAGGQAMDAGTGARDELELGLPAAIRPSPAAASGENAPAGAGGGVGAAPGVAAAFGGPGAAAQPDGSVPGTAPDQPPAVEGPEIFGVVVPPWAEPIVALVLQLKWKLVFGGFALLCGLYGYGCVQVTSGVNHLRNNLSDVGVALENANARGRAVSEGLIVDQVRGLARDGGISIPASAVEIFPERIRFERIEGGACRIRHLPDSVQRLPAWERDRILMGARTCNLPNWIVRIDVKAEVSKFLYSRDIDLTRYAAVLKYEGGYE